MKFMKKSILFLMMLLAATTVSAQDLVDRVSQAVGVELPSEYKGAVKAYVQGSKVLEGSGAIPTEQFIKEQMKDNWGISKQNQLLFIWDAIYEQITKKNFYDGEDGNKQRLEDFEKVMDNIETCGKKYKQDYIAYMERRSAEADRRSAEADRRSAEADRENLRLDSIGVKHAAEFYNLYIQMPNAAKQEEIDFMKKSTIEVIADCKKYNIDYKAILRKKLGDEQKVKDLLKFYGIE
jgi:hypothetical protein